MPGRDPVAAREAAGTGSTRSRNLSPVSTSAAVNGLANAACRGPSVIMLRPYGTSRYSVEYANPAGPGASTSRIR
ncbi:MAG: hypothetical protein F4145_08465 [Boseongicola sp. SB0675_bin_26]|nr:hypothetical protein [Boseongicola sp. SB0675_bin_26]